MSKIDDVRALFVPGEQIRCAENTYHREKGNTQFIGRVWVVEKVGKTVWFPNGGGFRGTFPTRVSDVLDVNDTSATWKIDRDDHTVTYERVDA